jgi:putative nucleotidyltransferase with HDIG domain
MGPQLPSVANPAMAHIPACRAVGMIGRSRSGVMADTNQLVDVERLRLGMYVVLDVGWNNHPFLRNSFTIRTLEQLELLRSLGRRQIRWCPERSIARPLPMLEPEAPLAEAEAELPLEAAEVSAFRAAAAAAFEVRDPLLRQEASLRRIEAEFLQGARQHRAMLARVLDDPAEAMERAGRLGDGMLRLFTHGTAPALRLMTHRVGDLPSGHDVGVAALGLMLAHECGFSPSAMRETALAALLHDVGKLHVPAALREDSDQLDEFERRTYRRHVDFGMELAASMGLPPAAVRAIGEHHERHDGSGFPAALSGQYLSPAGRVLAIVDRYHRLVCPTQVEAGLTPHLALQRMYGAERSHFDPECLARFVRLMSIYPPGTLVELDDGRKAVVVASRPGRSLAPRVQVLRGPDDTEPRLAFDIEPDTGARIRCGVRLDGLDPRWAGRARQLARSPLFLEATRRRATSPAGSAAVETAVA